MKLLAQLQATTSKLDKERMLKGISELEYKTFLQAYDPYYVYHMKFTVAGIRMYNLGEPTEGMFTLLGEIITKRIKGITAKRKVEVFAGEHGDLIKLVINKDLRCGVTATTFNNIYPGAIPQFKVQLAKAVALEKVEFPVLLQLKYDGVRLIALNKEGEVRFFTRNGKEVILPFLRKELEDIPMVNYMLDTEVTLHNGTQDERTKVSGMVNSAMHGGMVEESQMVLNCFDFMSLAQWEAAYCPDEYEVRFTVLMAFLEHTDSINVQLALTNEAHNIEAVNELYDAAISMDFEGLILKRADHLYTFKRSKDWVKLKEVKTADLMCCGVQAGTGKYDGMIGALLCEGTVEGKEVTVSVGSGLSDLQRSLGDMQYLGETIEVKYNAVIFDQVRKQWSLFLPRYVIARFDK